MKSESKKYRPFDVLFIYIPQTEEIIKIAEGTGDNLSKEDIAEGYTDYIYYGRYALDDSFPCENGGMILYKECVREKYRDLQEAVPAVLFDAYDAQDFRYVILRSGEYEEERSE